VARGRCATAWSGTARRLGNHLALEVRALPTGESSAGAWYVDVGLGDGLHEPLPLVAGSYRQPPYALSLRVSDIVVGGGGSTTMRAAPSWALTSHPERRRSPI
jgi:hypothetical protein